MRYRWLALALGTLALAGCIGPRAEAPRFAVAAIPKTPGYATLVVYRQAVGPLRRGTDLTVNGHAAVGIDAFTFTLILAKPGHVHIHSTWAFDLVLLPTGDAELDVQEGQVYYFEITPDLVQEDPDLAVGQLQACCGYQPADDDYVPTDYVPPTN